jgi:hypothetical protein
MAPVLTGGARLLPSFAVYESNSPPCGAGSPEGSPLRSSTPGLAIRAKVKTSAWRCQGQRRCLRAPCNTPVTLWQGMLPWKLSRISPQTNTSLFCALCAHSCTSGNNFPVGHPSSNRSRPSTFNLEFFSNVLPEKKVYLVDMSILSILLSPGPGCHTLTPLEDRRPRRSAPVQELPLLDTSMRPVSAHVPRRTPCPSP